MPQMWESQKEIEQEFIKAVSSGVKWVDRIQEANMWVCALSIKMKIVSFFFFYQNQIKFKMTIKEEMNLALISIIKSNSFSIYVKCSKII